MWKGLLSGWLLLACQVNNPADGQSRLSALEAEGQALTRAADALEARLLAGHSAVAHWKEMARRHREVSALACRVSTSHVFSMDQKSKPKPRRERVAVKVPRASTVSIQ